MDAVRSWALGLCFCAVVCSLSMMLQPSGATSKLFRLITGVLFLTCLISPLIHLKTEDFTLQFEDGVQSTAQTAEQAEKIAEELAYFQAENNIKMLVEELLKKNNIFPNKIEININTDATSNILLIGAVLYLPQSMQVNEQSILTLLEQELGIQGSCIFLAEDV